MKFSNSRIPIIFLFLIISFLSYGIVISLAIKDKNFELQQRKQIIKFNHALHADTLATMQMDCLYCHSDARKHSTASFPKVKECMDCHQVVSRDNEDVQRLLKLDPNSSPWSNISKYDVKINFPHNIHLAAEMSCLDCHASMIKDSLAINQKLMGMKECVDCHNEPSAENSKFKKASVDCSSCHF